MSIQIGIQLYTVRKSAEADPEGTIRKVAQAGYKGVQFAGYYGFSAQKMKGILDECGLKAAGSHVGYELLERGADAELEYARAIGLSYITVPGIGLENLLKPQTIDFLARFVEKAKGMGITVSYHNHFHEFTRKNGEFPLDILFREVPGLKMELDTYWADYAGVEPLAYMRANASRLASVHIKDRNKDPKKPDINANIGEGTLDIAAYLREAEKLHVGWAFVEMDQCDGDDIACMEISRKNLVKMGY